MVFLCLPVSYSPETTAEDFTYRKLKAFFERYGVLNQGFWRWDYFDTDEFPPFGKN